MSNHRTPSHPSFCHSNIVQAAALIVKEEGVTGLYSGLGVAVAKELTYVVTMMSFQTLASLALHRILDIKVRG